MIRYRSTSHCSGSLYCSALWSSFLLQRTPLQLFLVISSLSYAIATRHCWISCINNYTVMFFQDRWTPVTQTAERIHTGYGHWSMEFAKRCWGTHTTKALTSDLMTVWNIVLHFCHLQYWLLQVANYSHSAYVCCQHKNQWQSSPSPLVYWQKAAVIMASG